MIDSNGCTCATRDPFATEHRELCPLRNVGHVTWTSNPVSAQGRAYFTPNDPPKRNFLCAPESRAAIAAESLIAAKRLELLAQQLRACVAEASLGLTPAMSRHDAEDLVDQCNQQLQVIVANATAIEEAKT